MKKKILHILIICITNDIILVLTTKVDKYLYICHMCTVQSCFIRKFLTKPSILLKFHDCNETKIWKKSWIILKTSKNSIFRYKRPKRAFCALRVWKRSTNPRTRKVLTENNTFCDFSHDGNLRVSGSWKKSWS